MASASRRSTPSKSTASVGPMRDAGGCGHARRHDGRPAEDVTRLDGQDGPVLAAGQGEPERDAAVDDHSHLLAERTLADDDRAVGEGHQVPDGSEPRPGPNRQVGTEPGRPEQVGQGGGLHAPIVVARPWSREGRRSRADVTDGRPFADRGHRRRRTRGGPEPSGRTTRPGGPSDPASARAPHISSEHDDAPHPPDRAGRHRRPGAVLLPNSPPRTAAPGSCMSARG